MQRADRTRATRAGLAVAVLVVVAVAIAAIDRIVQPPLQPGPFGAAPATAPVTRAPTAPPIPGHEVYGYVPYWEMDDALPDHVAATNLTTLALFSVTHEADGSLATDEHGIRHIEGEIGRRLLDEAHARGTRVELVYTSFGTEKNERFLTDRAAQDRWITVLVEYAVARGFDGINVDVESLPATLVPAYGDFVGRLRSALRDRSPEAEVSVATQANQLGAAMALAASVAGADRIFLMGYDYRTAGSEPGASAPLDRTDGGEKDLGWSLDLYEALDVPVERTILGLPLYGVTWPVLGPGFGAMAVGRGDAWVPRRNLETIASPSFAPSFDPTESVEFYAAGSGDTWSAVYFDSPRSLRPKLELANARGLAGAGFWAIGYERGLPEYTALIESFRSGEVGPQEAWRGDARP